MGLPLASSGSPPLALGTHHPPLEEAQRHHGGKLELLGASLRAWPPSTQQRHAAVDGQTETKEVAPGNSISSPTDHTITLVTV